MKDLFQEKSEDWDRKETVRQISTAIGSSLLNSVTLHEKMSVMDFGAGTGLISSHIASQVGKITAVDISESMLQKLANKPSLRGKVECICRDICTKPLNQKFDLIISAMALHHVEDTKKLFRIFAKNLDAGSAIALADLDKEDGSFHPENIEGVFHTGFERDNLQNLLEEVGFEAVSFSTVHVVQKEEKEYPIFLLTATRAQ